MAALTPTAELRELDDFALQSKLTENKEELFNLRFQSATGQLENYSRLRLVRREIARLYTIMRERELGIIEADGAETVVDAKADADTDAKDVDNKDDEKEA